MRIIHTSDWHLGQYFYGKSRAKEHQQFLLWLIEQVNQHNVDAIVVAGDIFDTSTPPSYAREMYFNFISEMQSLSCQLIILAGNHDSVAMLGESKTLLSSLSTQVITHVVPCVDSTLMVDENDNEIECIDHNAELTNLNKQVFTIENRAKQALAVICAIPFIRPRDVIKSKAGQSATDKQNNLQQAISDHYQNLYQHAQLLVNKIEKEQGVNLPIIATGHLTALGVSMSDSQSDAVREIYIGTLEAFPSSAFPPADYIALGHIHRAQKVGKTEHIRYCGSPIALSFDEAKQDKRVLLVDFESAKLNTVTDLIIPKFQPLAMVKATLDNLADKLNEVLATDNTNDLTSFVSSSDSTISNVSISSEKIWVDIEIKNSEHLNDLSQRVNDIVSELPIEVLLVRRAKKSKQIQNQGLQEQNITLNELSVDDVFSSRLTEVEWSSEEEQERKSRLGLLFKQVAAQVTEQVGAQQSQLSQHELSQKDNHVKTTESESSE